MRSVEHVYVEQSDGVVEQQIQQKIPPDEFVNTSTPSVDSRRDRYFHFTISKAKSKATEHIKTLFMVTLMLLLVLSF